MTMQTNTDPRLDAGPRSRSNPPEVYPWPLTSFRGRWIVEGRVAFPEGATLPAMYNGSPVVWRREGDLWHFRLEVMGSHDTITAIVCDAWCGESPRRIDRAEWRIGSTIETGDGIGVAVVALDDTGTRPAAFLVVDDPNETEEGLQATADQIKLAFGPALELGPWQELGKGHWQAEVTAWHGTTGGAS